MTAVAGISVEVRGTTVVRCDSRTGQVVASHHVPTGAADWRDPATWAAALAAAPPTLLDGVAGIAAAAGSGALLALGEDGVPLDVAVVASGARDRAAGEDLVLERGGPERWAAETGVVPSAGTPVTLLRRLADHQPEIANRVATVLRPHDWMTAQLRELPLTAVGAPDVEPTTDTGDASGTGYWNPGTGAWEHEIVRQALGRGVVLPRVADPAELVGTTPTGVPVAAGTGEVMARSLGLGARVGDAVVRVGRSGAITVVSDDPVQAGPHLEGLADGAGRHLAHRRLDEPRRLLDAAAELLQVPRRRLVELAARAEPSDDGLLLLPDTDQQGRPLLLRGHGSLAGLVRDAIQPPRIARAAVEGALCLVADALDEVAAAGVPVRRVLLHGAFLTAPSVRELVPEILGRDVVVPVPGPHEALGAARQAAWALGGRDQPPDWHVRAVVERVRGGEGGARLRRRYAAASPGGERARGPRPGCGIT